MPSENTSPRIQGRGSQENPASGAEIAIIGGGMVGISLALLLSSANPDWRIILVESFPLDVQRGKRYRPSFDARSTALSAGSRDIFHRAGLWEPLWEHVTVIRRVHVSDKGHFGGSTIDASEHGLDAVGYVVENAWLGQVLAERLSQFAQIDCRAPASVTRVQASVSGYRITIENGSRPQQIDCRLLILADGADSQLRRQLGIAVDRSDYRQSALIANVACDRPHGGVAYERFTEQGPVALLPLGESDQSNTMALVWTQPAARAQDLLDCSDGEFLQGLQDHFGFRQGNFEKVSRRQLYPLQLSVAKEQIRRSLVLMGNAAHFLHPVAGQGFNLALRDCLALVEVLAGGAESGTPLNDVKLLETYLRKQIPDQWATIQLSDNFVRWFSSRDPAKSLLRNLGLFALNTLPPAKRLLANQTMGLA